jgi:FMN phosphatase YigB (HAD superfamily)
MFDMMLKGLHNRGHVVTAGDSADKDIAGPSRTGSTTLFGDEAGLHVREG